MKGFAPTRLRVRVFRLIAVSLPFVLLGIAELVTRLVYTGRSDPFVSLAQTLAVFSRVDVDGEEYYQVVHPEAYAERNVRFLVKKAPGTIRVFCIGESANAGWPQPWHQAWTEFLRQALVRSYPDRPVEVLNLSGHAQASFRLRWMFDDVIDMSPDAIVIWIGNNEFVEERSYFQFRRVNQLMQALIVRSRLVQALREVVAKRVLKQNVLQANRDTSRAVVSLFLDQPRRLKTDPAQYAGVLAHYRYNLEHMAEEASRRRVPIVFLTVPVNLRDWQPDVSVHSVEGDRLREWEVAYREGRRRLYRSENEAAIASLAGAAELDPGHAETRFHLARALLGAGRPSEARVEFDRARDLDANPIRSLGDFHEIVRSLPSKFGRAHVFDADAAFHRAAAGGVPGDDLFLDYVHPTRSGNLLVARGVFEMFTGGLLPYPSVSKEFAISEDGPDYDVNQDPGVLTVLTTLTAMARQYESSERYWRVRLALDLPAPALGLLTPENLELLRRFRECDRRAVTGEPVPGDEEIRRQWEALRRDILEGRAKRSARR